LEYRSTPREDGNGAIWRNCRQSTKAEEEEEEMLQEELLRASLLDESPK
jgi:hypothetical protein